MLTAEQLRLREPFDVTGSFVPPLIAGETAAINRQWRVRNGLDVPEMVATWAMKLGSCVEPLALDHHQDKTGQAITRRGEVVAHPDLPKVGCTLDGWRASDNWIVQVKVCGSWQSIPHILDYYTCQAMIEAECVKANGASILLVHGGGEPIEHAIYVDDHYRAAVWARIEDFITCVENLVEPFPPHIPTTPIIPPEKWRSINLDRDAERHNWAGEMMPLLKTWDETNDAAKANAVCKERIKTLLPDDVGHVSYAGTVISRSRNGAVSIRRAKGE
jgi:hypothetical protein